jgi:phosphatidylinositol/phosphatidylcholine transfer protein
LYELSIDHRTEQEENIRVCQELVHESDQVERDEIDKFCTVITYRRYLRAHRWHVDKAAKGIINTLVWRREFGVDTLVDDHLEQLKEQSRSGKMYTREYDKDGHPILCMHPAREEHYDHDGSLRLLVYSMERAVSMMDKQHGVEKLVLCIDFNGYSISNAPPFKTSKATLSILMDHYPERLHRAFLFQPPWAFSLFWKMISPFIDSVTHAKLVFNRGTEEQRVEAVQESIDPNVLAKAFNSHTVYDYPIDENHEAYWSYLNDVNDDVGDQV